MGGGGAMRAAAKVAGIGVAHGGFRGVPENPFSAAGRRAARPVSGIATSAEDGKLSGGGVLAAQKVEDSVQRPFWEIDDWELAGGEEEAGEPAPRVVFGCPPTAQEAKQATVELKDALEKTYLSPSFNDGKGSFLSGQEFGMLHLSNSEYMENKAVTESLNLPVSKHAIQAFRLFNESPAAQTVVASIASDPNVWNAVLQNHALVDFLESHKTSVSLLDMDKSTTETVDAADLSSPRSLSSPRLFDESCDTVEQSYGNGIVEILENFRVSVVEMMSSLSGFFQNLFVGPVAASASAEAGVSAGSASPDRALGASLMGLAVMVIMVVVLNRGFPVFTRHCYRVEVSMYSCVGLRPLEFHVLPSLEYIRANAVIVRKYRIIAFTCSDRRLALFWGAPPPDAYAEGVR
ncbi:hypothetical protein RJ639_046825 [Escallonia herrerae]|uniref:Uncharacterized protein n=1 Tax=Escallonia herrerae TaxID=1293975 RepID=A0AA88W5T0_9ASTE|nr:hypothetical protein RJ639_046825 [Escallonia herrerae]